MKKLRTDFSQIGGSESEERRAPDDGSGSGHGWTLESILGVPNKAARVCAGLLLFAVGMSVNIHSDHILRCLRKPGETVYRIPYGGMFEWVSGANFFGEMVEWVGYAVAVWSIPAFAFAFFTLCSIGPRAYSHHRFYLQKFPDYPRSRKAVLPFLL